MKNRYAGTTADSPTDWLAAGFGAHVEGWALRLGADAASARAAAAAASAVSLATAQGHVCIGLHALGQRLPAERARAGDAAALRTALLDSRVVGTAQQPGALPLVLDDDGRLYLHRYFDYERRLAARLVRAASAPAEEIDAATHERLNALFAAGGGGDHALDRQKLAAAIALRGRLLVVSGGPGTGKTTTVVNLLACLLARDPSCRVALTAPTGKAAARLADAIRRGARRLPSTLRARLPVEASTVHRLLGAAPAGFSHDPRRPLPIDVLVVDEASMLDLALATRLLEAVPEAARIVLLGDKDQLAAVESGAVLAEIGADASKSAGARRALGAACGVDPDALVMPPAPQPTPIADAVVWFERNYRFAAASGIGRLAAAVNAGRADEALAALRQATDDDALHWIADGQARPEAALQAAIVGGYEAYFDAVANAPADVAAVMAAFERFRVLGALREGPRGVEGLNALLTERARSRLKLPPAAGDRSPWFVGRPVIVLRNDAVLELFNGDIGITLPAPDGEPMVHFPSADGGFRAVAAARLPAHQSAFALTVHKAQGSEFDEVLIVLPAQPAAVLSRELLYTAVTRARRRVSIAANAAVMAAAIGTPTRRHSGLIARLRAAAEATPPGAP